MMLNESKPKRLFIAWYYESNASLVNDSGTMIVAQTKTDALKTAQNIAKQNDWRLIKFEEKQNNV